MQMYYLHFSNSCKQQQADTMSVQVQTSCLKMAKIIKMLI